MRIHTVLNDTNFDNCCFKIIKFQSIIIYKYNKYKLNRKQFELSASKANNANIDNMKIRTTISFAIILPNLIFTI